MNYKVLLVAGKVETFYMEAVAEYRKRLGRYCKTELIRIKNPSQLSKKISDKYFRIVISTKGQPISSEELAERISSLALTGRSDVAVIIGAGEMECDVKIAIGPMEMDPGLMAVIVFEQIYRAYRIINSEPYHK
ncbi:MAG: 23S rRNA (pseudouridine(1915)-N(3))-methyltransferase RlmH [Clostridia bacterium]|jgi:23S rRNA (pseudouridine1915-N3)-methyltransferase|nr:50S rRNA methyltransferase [Clostridiales bacterium]